MICDESNNPSQPKAGKITLIFGFAPIRLAEFVSVTMEHDTAQ
ncbi:hypothetical protein [Streptomyces sp. SCL15-6]|nr:hypothetical protein [Streptomyces sp. SCL15-6]